MDKLNDWRRTHYSSEINGSLDGKKTTVFGWVQTVRDLGKIKFIMLSDRDGEIQITIPMKTVDAKLADKIQELKKQATIGVRGTIKKSDRAERGVEIIPDEIKILNTAQHPLALDPTGRIPADIDVRLNARILDLRRSEIKAIFRINHAVNRALREYFDKAGFIDVQTPKIIATSTEGGAALFPVLYFDKEAFLAQSPQLYKEQLTSVFEKVYEIAPYFRAEESRTTRHTAEFISVDIEEAFATVEDVMKTLEEMLLYTVKHLKANCQRDLETLKCDIPLPKTPSPKYTYSEILKMLADKDSPIKWGEDIPTPALRTLGEILPNQFYFITDWPTEQKPFYIKPKDDDPAVSESFDFMYGWFELASGGTRIHDKQLLIARMKEQGLNPESFEHHLKVFDWGMPPHAGWGLGLSRLVVVLTCRDNVRECILFPRDKDRLTP